MDSGWNNRLAGVEFAGNCMESLMFLIGFRNFPMQLCGEPALLDVCYEQ